MTDNIFQRLAIDVRESIDAEQLVYELLNRAYPCEEWRAPRTCGDDCICQSISRIACALATLIRISVANVKISYIYLDRCCLREFLRWIIISAISIYMNP